MLLMFNRNKKAFTLIELLVVIAIIAILAAILFPVFAQAKTAAKKASDLSNLKQIGLSCLLYTNDNEDNLPNYVWPEDYQLASYLAPYTKSRAIWHNPGASINFGVIQKKQNPTGPGGAGSYMTDPNDSCLQLGVSKVGLSGYYSDVYAPMDYQFNSVLWGYGGDNCPSTSKIGQTHKGPNIVSGGTSGAGNEGYGPSITWNAPASVALITDFPVTHNDYPANTSSGPDIAGFWGTQDGWFGGNNNITFADGHSKSYPAAKMDPGLRGDNIPDDSYYHFCTPYGQSWSTDVHAGTCFSWWGTSVAAPGY